MRSMMRFSAALAFAAGIAGTAAAQAQVGGPRPRRCRPPTTAR